MSSPSDAERIAALEAQLADVLKFLGHDAREGHSSTLALLELQRIKPDPMTVGQLAERMEANARKSLAAIDDFADLMRARSDPLDLEELDLLDLMLEVVADVWTPASQAGIRIQVAEHPPTIMGLADREWLSRALARLLRDAVAGATRGATITCALRAEEDDRLLFEIGAPVAEPAAADLHPREARRAARPPAGLALARAVALRHAGTFNVEAAPGGRQWVHMRLPSRRLAGAPGPP